MAWNTILRRPAAALAAAALMLLAACGGKKSEDEGTAPKPTVTVTVKVNYLRVPLRSDANGVPTGLETDPTKFKSMPARGIRVRLWEAKDETNPDGTKTRVWVNPQTVVSDSTGSAVFSGTAKDTDGFVEVLSQMPIQGGGTIRVVADPAGINSGLAVGERVMYALRKGLDGNAPAGNATPGAKVAADATVTFDVGLADKWWLTLPNSSQIASATQESTGTGSRVLAILDSMWAFNDSGLGNPSPGDSLDLHYRAGISESRDTFVEYDRLRYPLSFDSTTQTNHFFGSIKAGSADDDAFDEAVLYTLAARNGLYAVGIATTAPVTGKALPDLQPDLALVEALPFVQAANLLKSPYLADTTAAGASNLDIRALGSFASGPVSGPAIASLGWELTLKANSLPSPGTVTDWTKINPKALIRFFSLTVPSDLSDRPNLFLQLARLKEAKGTQEPVDLAAIFTDAALTTLTAPYSIPWPRPTTGAHATYILDWDKDPNSLAAPLSPLQLSMAKAAAVSGTYPNTSAGEATYRKFSLSKDTAYNLRVTTVPATLPAGTKVQVRLFAPSVIFEATGSDTPATRLTLRGNKDTAIKYLMRIGLSSPANLSPDVTVTVSLDAVN
jgi:hypothetical protein